MSKLAVLVATSLASWLLIRVILGWAQRRRILDMPNSRSSHSQPTPRGGGLAIAGICLVGWAAAWFLAPACSAASMLGFLVGGTLIAAISWIDDLWTLPSLPRFLTHAVGAVAILASGAVWQSVSLPLVGDVHLGWLGLAASFLWIIGLTNAYNFMDGIDGIAAVQATVAGLSWLYLGVYSDMPMVAVLGLLIAGSSLGFLGHNWPPARIFMGDVGSAFLGFSFAFLALFAAERSPRLAVAGVLLLWPMIFDASFTFLRRLFRSENVFAAHRSHLYQRLIIIGWRHAAVTAIYGGLALIGTLLAVVFVQQPGWGDWLAVLAMPVLAAGFWGFVCLQERVCGPRQEQPNHDLQSSPPRSVVTLLYHDVVDRPEASGFQRPLAFAYKVPLTEFRKHLDIVAEGPIPPTRVLDLNPRATGRFLFLNFDDGGVSALDVAQILEEKGWRGHFFIVTGKIGSKGFLNRDEIRDLHRRGHVIGSHSHEHPDIFYNLSEEQMLDEWQTSCRILCEITGEPVLAASVPGGDMDLRTIETAGRAGIRYLFTSEPVLAPWEHSGITCFGRLCLRGSSSTNVVARYVNFQVGLREIWIRRLKQVIKRLIGPVYAWRTRRNELAVCRSKRSGEA